jgi:hypothetical protein
MENLLHLDKVLSSDKDAFEIRRHSKLFLYTETTKGNNI